MTGRIEHQSAVSEARLVFDGHARKVAVFVDQLPQGLDAVEYSGRRAACNADFARGNRQTVGFGVRKGVRIHGQFVKAALIVVRVAFQVVSYHRANRLADEVERSVASVHDGGPRAFPVHAFAWDDRGGFRDDVLGGRDADGDEQGDDQRERMFHVRCQ